MNNYPIVAIIPSLNPDAMLERTVKSIKEAGFSDIIIVDDGSKQDCKKYFSEVENVSGVVVLCHDTNRGKGAALKTAFGYYLQNYDLNYFKGVVTADADGQHLATDIRKVANEIVNNSGEECLCLGTRNFNEKIVPFKSKNGNKITTKIFKLLFDKLINDTQTGLRGISNSFIYKCVELKENRFEYEINMLIQAVRNNVIIKEVPISTVYYEGNRETHFRPFRDSFKIYRVMFKSFLKFTCSGLISWVVDWGSFTILARLVFANPNADKVILASTIFARIISSLVNYYINRKIVFEKKGNKSLLRYYILCLCQMFISAGFVSLLCSRMELPSSLVKIPVDAVIFFVNYKIQQNWVFKEKNND